MTHTVRFRVFGLVILLVGVAVTGCNETDEALPAEICGTKANAGLVEPLVADGGDWNEFNRVDRKRSVTAPCVLLSGRDPVLEFRFSWTKDKPDLLYLAGTGTVSGVRDPQPVDLAEDAVVGADGAIVTASCEKRDTDYFTLGLQLPRVEVRDPGHREDIERFMREYFPATVKTLDCR
ncbi:hypothetical protein [Streptomyces sp. NPDC002640]